MTSNRASDQNGSKKIRRRSGPGKDGSQSDIGNNSIPALSDPESASAQDHLTKLGNRISDLRTRAGYNLRQFATKINLDNSKLSKIERGKINITILTLKAIYEGLEVSPEDFWKF